MPETREIRVRLIAESRMTYDQVEEWMRSLGADDFADRAPYDSVEPAEALVGLAAKRCYMSFEPGLNPNVTKVRTDWAEYLDNVLKSGHGSVLEHASFSFAIENVTRVFTAEMNRHRAGWAISEASMRFIRFDECIPYWLPESIRGEDVIDADEVLRELVDGYGPRLQPELLREIAELYSNDALAARKQLTRAVFADVFEYVQCRYGQLVALWDMDESDRDFSYKKKVTSCLRRIVPLGVCTGGVWTGNVRALRHVITMRSAPEAEEEIARVFTTIGAVMAERCPMLFGDFTPDENGFYRPRYKKV